jgi:hypothetical protein
MIPYEARRGSKKKPPSDTYSTVTYFKIEYSTFGPLFKFNLTCIRRSVLSAPVNPRTSLPRRREYRRRADTSREGQEDDPASEGCDRERDALRYWAALLSAKPGKRHVFPRIENDAYSNTDWIELQQRTFI